MADDVVGKLRALLTLDSAEFETVLERSSQSAKRWQQGLTRLVNEFNGSKLVGEATRMTEAIAKVGGVSKLTETELARATATITAFTTKARLLGTDIPPAVAKLSTELTALGAGATQTGTLFGGMSGIISKLGPLLPIASVAGLGTALIRMGSAALESASQITDLSQKTGLSTDAIQRMQAVANQTGTTVEAFAQAAFKLGVNVSDGSKKARDSVRDLGLSYAELRAQKPEEQFATVVRALEGVDNQQERNRIGVALFGKQFSEIAAAIENGYSQIADAANVSSADQIAALDAAGDAWDKFKDDVAASVRSFLGSLAMGAQSGAKFREMMDALKPEQREEVATLNRSQFTAGMFGMSEAAKALTVELTLLNDRQKGVSSSAGKAGTAARDYAKELAAARLEVGELSTAQRTQLNAALQVGGDAAQTYADKIGLSETALRLYQGSLKAGTKDTDAFTKAQDALFGRDLIARANDFAKQLGGVSNATKLSVEKKLELNKAVTAAIDAYARLGMTAPQALRDLDAATRPLLVSTRQWATVELRAAVAELTPFTASVRSLGVDAVPLLSASIHQSRLGFVELKPAIHDAGEEIRALIPDTMSLGKALKESLVGALSNIPQTIADGLIHGNIGGAIKSIVSQVGSAIGSSLGFAIGGPLGQKIGAALGSLAGMLVEPLKKIFGIGINDEVKKWNVEIQKTRDELLKTHGSLDQLEAKANAVGLSFKAAWGHQGQEGLRQFNALIDEFTKRTAEAAARMEALKEEAGDLFDELMDAAAEAGNAIPNSMRSVLEQFAALGLLTTDQIAQMRALGNSAEIDWKKMEEAAGRYGIEEGALGTRFNGARLHASAQVIINDFDLLTRGGGDVGGVLFGMREEISQLVRDSQRFGTAIPENMRPWIQELLRSGNLLDENGDAMTDLGNLRWSDRVKTQAELIADAFAGVTAKIEELIDRIANGLAPAIANLPAPRLPEIGNGRPGEIVPPDYGGGLGGPVPGYGGVGAWASRMAASAALAAPLLSAGSFAGPIAPPSMSMMSALSNQPSITRSVSTSSTVAHGGNIIIVDGYGKNSAQIREEILQNLGTDVAGNRYGIRVALDEVLSKRRT